MTGRGRWIDDGWVDGVGRFISPGKLSIQSILFFSSLLFNSILSYPFLFL